MKLLSAIFFFTMILIAQPSVTSAQDTASTAVDGKVLIRVLLVVAHPDDESEMAGTIYRIAKESSGVVDQVVISDGEGGFRYSALAGRYYGADLASESVGRALLPHIRQGETRQAGRVLGIRRLWFLNERDEHFTLNADEVLQQTWRTTRVQDWLVQRLRKNRYDLIFVLLPTEDTHGEHKAASILALRAVEQLPENQRPAVLGVQASPKDTDSYKTLSGYPITAANSSEPQFHFDRDVHFGFRNSLSYQIVVDWVIAEHKSQGLFQTTVGQNRFENFWVFSTGENPTNKKVLALLADILYKPRAVEPIGNIVTAR
jgi:N-acetylglucosamine malate deacetylase 2